MCVSNQSTGTSNATSCFPSPSLTHKYNKVYYVRKPTTREICAGHNRSKKERKNAFGWEVAIDSLLPLVESSSMIDIKRETGRSLGTNTLVEAL